MRIAACLLVVLALGQSARSAVITQTPADTAADPPAAAAAAADTPADTADIPAVAVDTPAVAADTPADAAAPADTPAGDATPADTPAATSDAAPAPTPSSAASARTAKGAAGGKKPAAGPRYDPSFFGPGLNNPRALAPDAMQVTMAQQLVKTDPKLRVFVDEYGAITLTDQYGRPREDLEGLIEPTPQQEMARERAEYQMELEQQEREHQMELEQQEREYQMELEQQERERQMELEQQERELQMELEEQRQQRMLEMQELQGVQGAQAAPILNTQQEQFLLRFLRENPVILTNFLQSLGYPAGPKGANTRMEQQA